LNTFDLIHVDIWGPVNIVSVYGHKYFLTIVDDYSRHTWIYLMKAKSETETLLHNFATYVKNQFGLNIKTIRSDNGKEFVFSTVFNKFGFLHQRTCVETPQQNSVVERKHQHILNIT